MSGRFPQRRFRLVPRLCRADAEGCGRRRAREGCPLPALRRRCCCGCCVSGCTGGERGSSKQHPSPLQQQQRPEAGCALLAWSTGAISLHVLLMDWLAVVSPACNPLAAACLPGCFFNVSPFSLRICRPVALCSIAR